MAARKSGRDSSGSCNSLSKRISRFKAFLRTLKLAELFSAMPRALQESFVVHKFPDPLVEFDASFPRDAAGDALRRAVEDKFRDAAIDFEFGPISLRDFYSVAAGLYYTVKDSRKLTSLP